MSSAGSTSLVKVDNHYYLNSVSGGTSLLLKQGGAAFAAGSAGGWVPIGAEKTSSGYQVVWKISVDEYSVWNTDNNGNYIANAIGVVSGASAALLQFETSFQQDLNGDGTISSAAATIANSTATTAGQSTVAPDSQKMPFDVVDFLSDLSIGGWHFKIASQSDGVNMSGLEGPFIGSAGSQLLTQLVREALEITDGTHETFGSHENAPIKVLVDGLHAGSLISC